MRWVEGRGGRGLREAELAVRLEDEEEELEVVERVLGLLGLEERGRM